MNLRTCASMVLLIASTGIWACNGPGCDLDACGKQSCSCWDYLEDPRDKVVDACVSSFGDTRSYSLEDDDGTEVFSCEERGDLDGARACADRTMALARAQGQPRFVVLGRALAALTSLLRWDAGAALGADHDAAHDHQKGAIDH